MFVVMNVKYLKETMQPDDRNASIFNDKDEKSEKHMLPSVASDSHGHCVTSNTTVHDLPDEVLINIFSFLTVEDLALRIRNVCKRWALVSEDSEVWRGKIYDPSPNLSFAHIQSVLKQAPMLQAFYASSFFSEHCFIFLALISNLSHLKRLSVPVRLGNHDVVSHLLLKNCETITDLDIRFCKGFMDNEQVELYSAEILKCIGMCANLQSLTISGSISCDARGFAAIADKCIHLQKLNIQNSNIYVNNLELLLERNAYTIVSLNLSWDYEGQQGTLPVVAKHCQKLEKLSVVEPDGYFGFKAIASDLLALESMVNLKELSLPCVKVDVLNDFLCLFQKCVFKNLVKLDFSHSRWLKNSLLDIIFKTCSNLKCLLLQHSYEITSSGLEFIYCLTQLQHLNLEGCVGLRNDAISYIVQCKSLRYLNVNRIFIFNQDSLKLCCDNLKSLRELHMIVHGISQEDLKNVPNHLSTFLQYIKYCW